MTFIGVAGATPSKLDLRTQMLRLSERIHNLNSLDSEYKWTFDQEEMDAHLGRAKAHFLQSRCHQSLVEIEALLVQWQNPNPKTFLDLYFYRTICSERTMQWDKAAKSAKAFLSMTRYEAGSERTQEILDLLFKLRKSHAVNHELDSLFQALHQRAFDNSIYALAAKTAVLHDDFALAQRILEQMDPKDIQQDLFKGIAYVRAGRLDEAHKSFEALLQTDLREVALLSIARVYVARNDLARSLEYYQMLSPDRLAQLSEEYALVLLQNARWDQAWEIGKRGFESGSRSNHSQKKQLLASMMHAFLMSQDSLRPDRLKYLRTLMRKDTDVLTRLEKVVNANAITLSTLIGIQEKWQKHLEPTPLLSQFTKALWQMDHLDHKMHLGSQILSHAYQVYGINEHWFFKSVQLHSIYEDWRSIQDQLIATGAQSQQDLSAQFQRNHERRLAVLKHPLRDVMYTRSHKVSLHILQNQLDALWRQLLNSRAQISSSFMLSEKPSHFDLERLQKLQGEYVLLKDRLAKISTSHAANRNVMATDFHRMRELANLYQSDLELLSSRIKDQATQTLIQDGISLSNALFKLVERFLEDQEKSLKGIFAKMDVLRNQSQDQRNQRHALQLRLNRSFENQKERLVAELSDTLRQERAQLEKWLADLEWYGSRIGQKNAKLYKQEYLQVLEKLRSDLLDQQYGVSL
jgi:hypothetical protein